MDEIGASGFSADPASEQPSSSPTSSPTAERPPTSKWWTAAIILACFVGSLGVAFRYAYVLHWHQPSDVAFQKIPMNGYESRAINSINPNRRVTLHDIVFPPGGHMFLAIFLPDPSIPLEGTPQERRTQKWRWAVLAQFLLCVLTPFLIAAIGYEMYGRGVALVAFLISSLYFSFIDYAGFFMTEGNFLFFLVLTMWLLARSIRVKNVWIGVTCGLLAGASLGVTASFKTVVLFPGVLIFLVMAITACRLRWKRLFVVMATSFVGLMLIVVPLIVRATRINDGHLVPISTNGAMTVLMGHYGKIRKFNFRPPRGGTIWFSAPAANQRKYKQQATLRCGPWDSDKMLEAAWKWTKENPQEALACSCLNVLDLFYGSLAFPSNKHPVWRQWVDWFQWVFWIFILLPAVLFLASCCWRRLSLEKTNIEFADMLLLLPILGLVIVAFFTIGQPRYRIPFDAFFILLAARFYTWGVMRPDGLVPRRAKGPG